MKHETRANLIFFALFLAISLPGAVILFKKKLDPAAPAMFLPDPVRTRIPYTAPVPDLPGVRRVVPPLTASWLTGVVAERAGAGFVRVHRAGTPGKAPAISDDRAVEVVAMKASGAGTTLCLVIWDPQWGGVPLRVTAGPPGAAGAEGRPVAGVMIPLPPEVRRELDNLGHSTPPARVRWLEVEFPAAPGVGTELRIEVAAGEGDARRSVVRVAADEVPRPAPTATVPPP